MDETYLKVLKKRGQCTYNGNCFFKHGNSECYKESYCKDKIPYATKKRTRQSGLTQNG